MTNGDGKQRSGQLKVFGGLVVIGTERKKNEASGEKREAESFIMEESRAAAEGTMGGFSPARVWFQRESRWMRWAWQRGGTGVT